MLKFSDLREDLSDKLTALEEKLERHEQLAGFLNGIGQRFGWRQWLLISGAVLVVFLGAGYAVIGGRGAGTQQMAAENAGQNIYFTVRSGMGIADIGRQLEQHRIIPSATRFRLYVKWKGLEDKFQTGVYALHPGMDMDIVISMMVNGETTAMKFTIPEGFGIKEIARRLSDMGLVDEKEFLTKAKTYAPYDYMRPADKQRAAQQRYAAEGFLFPDTYELHEAPTVDGIMRLMAQDLDTRLTPQLRERAAEMNLSLYDLITLASLVEKEARYEEDRPMVAQVFLKRLQVGMPLQTDTTLQYLMDAPKEDVSLADTRIESPYNTYQHDGLPPGPIASPGMAAIKAVLYPSATDYLYFVADRDGHNHYATNYADHMVNVNKYR